ncbi:Uncharacterized protein APZ42_029844 [Daphnia magna]|uniref:Uncharacterized protein n=1 Tax=Daphnia magna TaxID=35525 RepID=A0A164P9W4_9CRUS|nr:Uncharacterized protein APZ42_029844 [Daphnia magna]
MCFPGTCVSAIVPYRISLPFSHQVFGRYFCSPRRWHPKSIAETYE